MIADSGRGVISANLPTALSPFARSARAKPLPSIRNSTLLFSLQFPKSSLQYPKPSLQYQKTLPAP
jgi:hypothetical protein